VVRKAVSVEINLLDLIVNMKFNQIDDFI